MELLTASAIASLILTQTFEKLGEQVGTRGMESIKKLWEIMNQKYPKIVEQELKGQLSYREALAQIETAVKEDPAVAEAVIEVGEAVKSEPNQEILFQILSNVIIRLQEEPQHIYNVQYNFPNDNTFLRGKKYAEQTHLNLQDDPQAIQLQSSYIKNKQLLSVTIAIFSLTLSLSLVFIALLVLFPLSLDIQQVLVALIALLVVFSLSALKRLLVSV